MDQRRGHNDGIRQNPEELQRLVAMYNAGNTFDDIGSKLGVSGSRIQQIVVREIHDGKLTRRKR